MFASRKSCHIGSIERNHRASRCNRIMLALQYRSIYLNTQKVGKISIRGKGKRLGYTLRYFRVVSLGNNRKFFNDGVGFSNFIVTAFRSEILTTACAVPVFNIAFGCGGCRLGFNMFEIGMIVRVKFAINKLAIIADCFTGTGSFTTMTRGGLGMRCI